MSTTTQTTSPRFAFPVLPPFIRERLEANRALFLNTLSLVAATAVNSGLGFAFWWVATRSYTPEAVGLASAANSAMMLLGAVGLLGLGTVLIGEVAREPHKAGSTIVTASLVAGAASAILGVLFALASPVLTPELAPLSQDLGSILLFASGVVFTAVTLIVDQALIGLLRGSVQFGRNAFFAVAKLGLVVLFAGWFSATSGLSIYAAWMLGNALSLIAVAVYWFAIGNRVLHRPQFGLMRQLGRTALAHHAGNLILQAPTLILPIAVTALLSASANASFYSAWMLASFVFVIPSHLTTVLHAVGSKEPRVLAAKMHMTMRLSFLITLPMAAGLFLLADPVLHLFGEHYAEMADWCLRILAIGVFPLIFKYHYIAWLRVTNRVQSAVGILLLGGVLEVGFAAVGLQMGALTGLAIGWLIAVLLNAAVMGVRLNRALSEGEQAALAPAT